MRLLSTVQQSVVYSLFDDAEYPWWLQGQFALLSRFVPSPPQLGPYVALLGTLVEPEWTDALKMLQGAGIDAIFRPGVDGSVAGVHCTSSDTCEALKNALQEAGIEFGVMCHMLSETAFAAALH